MRTHVTECGGTLTSGDGMFASPNYPEDYSNNLDCEWVIRFISKLLCFNYHSVDQSPIFSIRLGVTDQIKTSFLNFNTEQCYDYVELRDGGDDTSMLVGK